MYSSDLANALAAERARAARARAARNRLATEARPTPPRGSEREAVRHAWFVLRRSRTTP